MNHLLVSFHASGTPRDQVIYFHMHSADKDLLTDLFAEYAPNDYLPKEEVYRGKRMVIYPLGYTEYLATYAEDGFLVVSFQKKLIEQAYRVDWQAANGGYRRWLVYDGSLEIDIGWRINTCC